MTVWIRKWGWKCWRINHRDFCSPAPLKGEGVKRRKHDIKPYNDSDHASSGFTYCSYHFHQSIYSIAGGWEPTTAGGLHLQNNIFLVISAGPQTAIDCSSSISINIGISSILVKKKKKSPNLNMSQGSFLIFLYQITQSLFHCAVLECAFIWGPSINNMSLQGQNPSQQCEIQQERLLPLRQWYIQFSVTFQSVAYVIHYDDKHTQRKKSSDGNDGTLFFLLQ